jgi:3-hydroxyisobutyrate dehydrogenase
MNHQRSTVVLSGTGTMGAGMARNIAGAGSHSACGTAHGPRRSPSDAGALVADTAAEAVRGADVVITMLFDTDSVVAALESARDGLSRGTVLLQ